MDHSLHVAVDVGRRFHEVAVGDGTGRVLDAFRIGHEPEGFGAFFKRVADHRSTLEQPVRVAMESYNDWARPLDSLVLEHGWALYNVNNLKLARYKEISPAPTKSDAIDSHRMLELLTLDGQRGVARNALQRVTVAPDSHRRLKYLTRRRRVLVQERAGRVTRLRSDLQALGALGSSLFFYLFSGFHAESAVLRTLYRSQPGTGPDIRGPSNEPAAREFRAC